LTIAADPAGSGATTPVSGATTSPLTIAADPADGFRFAGWTITGSGSALNPGSPVTTLLMSGPAAATARFAEVPYLTLGSVASFTVDSLDGFEGAVFGGKPAMSVFYPDPLAGDSVRPDKKAKLKTAFDQASSDRFTAEWTKKQPLFDKRAIPPEMDSWTYLRANAIEPLVCPATVQAKTTGGTPAVHGAGQVCLPPPEITGIQDQDGILIDPPVVVAPGETVYLVGRYFGTKAPKVWFEHNQNGRIKQTRCKPVKPLLSIDYPDSKGKPSCMDCATGDSRVPVIIPGAKQIPEGGFLGFIVLDNGIGRDTCNLTIATE
jgi:hypothetical protein